MENSPLFTPSFGEHMKNKNFYSLSRAKRYFNWCSNDYICFLIHDLETDTYGVITEDHLRYLQEDFNLCMEVLLES